VAANGCRCRARCRPAIATPTTPPYQYQPIGSPLSLKLPTIPIALLPEDPELPPRLQAAFQSNYNPAFYDRQMTPPLPLRPPILPLGLEPSLA
jgi:hypothetical protein